MASVYIVKRATSKGVARYDVKYRLGGRETRLRHGGSFRTRREAEERRRWVGGELAAHRIPDLTLEREAPTFVPLRDVAERWRASRIDVGGATRKAHHQALLHVNREFGDRDPTSLDPHEVAAWIGVLAGTYTRATLEKVLGVLRMILDSADIRPNPARDDRVKLPRGKREEIQPPSAEEVVALLERTTPRYRLPLLVLESTGMRVNELETLAWGDIDEQHGRWRVARQNEKAGRGRWVNVPPDVFEAVTDRVPREDRDLDAPVFPGATQTRLRTDMARACKAAGIPLYSPHDLRHRRISLWHMQGVPLAQVGQWVGQRNLSVTADTYTHVITDAEIARGAFLVIHR